MPINNETTKVFGTGNGATTQFSIAPMVVFKSSEILVIHKSAIGIETVITEGTGPTNFSFTPATPFKPGQSVTGTVTYPADEVTPMATGETITVKRLVPLTQAIDLENQGGYFPDTLDEGLDRAVMIALQQQEELDRGIQFSVTDPNVPTTDIPGLALRAGKLFGFGETLGEPVVTNTTIAAFEAAVSGISASGAGFASQQFAGDGSTVAFTVVGANILTKLQVVVSIDGLTQAPVNYAAVNAGSDVTVTLTTAPPSGTEINIVVFSVNLATLESAVSVTAFGQSLVNTIDAAAARVLLDAAALDTANVFTKTQTWLKGADVASVAALTLGDGNYFDITGTATITSIGTKGVGTVVRLHFDAAATLTHHATDLVLPKGTNITAAAGDEATFVEYAAGDWRCVNYQRANGRAVAGPLVGDIVPGSEGDVATTVGGVAVWQGSAFTTGDVKLTFKTAADATWVIVDDGSIGDAGSGATTRANADTEDLYTLLWDNVSDTYAPVSTGRGANAAADFAAGKTLTIPIALGRSLGIAGAGATLTSRALGENLGEETHVQTLAELAAHDHDIVTTGGSSGGISGVLHQTDGNTGPTSIDYSDNAGSSTGFNVMQPTVFMNIMIKL